MNAIRPGMRVVTPEGLGTVVYVRNAPPDYATVEAVCVLLDAKKDRSGYVSTVYPVEQIKGILAVGQE